MRQIMLPNKSQRQLKIIRFFFANRGKLFNYDNLAVSLESSISVVFSDIQDIELKFPEEILIERQSKQGVTLKIKPHLSYNYFFKKYAHDSTEFRLLDDLIHQRYQRMNQAADDLFVSRTTISRAVDHMNKFFSHRGWPILVQRSPMGLKMDETIYRQVYPLFVDAFYFLKDWPFDQVSYSAIHEFFNQFAKVSTFFKTAQKYPITYIRLACNLTRYLDQQLVDTNQADLSLAKAQMLLDALPTDHHFIDLATGRLPLNKEIMQQLMVGIVSDQTILRSQCIDRKFFTSQSYFDYYTGFLNDVNLLAKQYGLTSTDQDNINLIGMNVHNYCFTKIEIRELFADVNPSFMGDLREVIEQINPDFIQELELLLVDYMNQTNIPLINQVEALEYLLFLTLSNWPNIAYELGKNRDHVRVLLYTGNHGLDIKVRSALDNNVQGFVDIEVIDHTVDWTKSNQLPHDIFILSEQLPFVAGKPCYIFTAFNDLEMMRWVYQQAEDIIQAKA